MIMSKTLETLQVIAANVRGNLVNVNAALAQAVLATEGTEPEVRDAVMVLMEKFVHGQAVIAVVQSFDQVISLTKTKTEMEALIAAVEVSARNEAVVLEIDSELAAASQASAAPAV
jgi:hypothetical protein